MPDVRAGVVLSAHVAEHAVRALEDFYRQSRVGGQELLIDRVERKMYATPTEFYRFFGWAVRQENLDPELLRQLRNRVLQHFRGLEPSQMERWRQHVRYATSVAVSICAEGLAPFHGRIQTCSRGGFLIRCDENRVCENRVRESQVIDFEFVVEGRGTVCGRGCVRWARREMGALQGPFFGVEILSVEERDRDTFEQWIRGHHRVADSSRRIESA